MKPELPTHTDTANKLTLAKQQLMQIIADPKYKTFTDEISVFQNFLSGKGSSLDEVLRALKSMKQQVETGSPSPRG
jgi:hypothetical protein